MQDISKKIKFLKLRKKLWRSWPYKLYLKGYDFVLKKILQLNKRNVKIIFINGMRRSGNHYLMKTLMDSTTASVIFYNNQQKLKPLDIKNGLQTKFRRSKKILLMIGYEDLLIDDFVQSYQFILKDYFPNVQHLQLIILRDIRNIMASRLNHAHMADQLRESNDIVNSTKELWVDHHLYEGESDCHIIRYRHLLSDINAIDLAPFFISSVVESQKVLNRYGGGSSFENSNFNSRYTFFKGDQIFESLIAGQEKLDEQVHGVW